MNEHSILKGIAVSPGVAVAKPLIMRRQEVQIEKRHIDSDCVDAEVGRFRLAVKNVKENMKAVLESLSGSISKSERDIFNVHIALLEDPELVDQTITLVKQNQCNSEYALDNNIKTISEELGGIEDDYIKERVADIQDVGSKVIMELLGLYPKGISEIAEDVIAVAEDIEPSLLITADKKQLKGIVCEQGGLTSHTAIIARNLGLPAVFGIKDIVLASENADCIIINGDQVTINPLKDEVNQIKSDIKQLGAYRAELNAFIKRSAETKDGMRIGVYANIGEADEAHAADQNGAEGVGLFRTEFMFMGRSQPPTEDEQFTTYKKAVETMKNRPVIIRTLDVGGDKKIDYLDLPKEENPFLGCRAIRLCLKNKALFKIQLRALLRAAVYGNLKIMYPMISSLEEVCEANVVLDECKQELLKEGVAFKKNIPVGIMIEIPSAALCADILAEEVDFFSIGTNDLIQYTTAVDRTNTQISNLYDEYNPGVLRLIERVAKCANDAKIEVGICGEMGSNVMLAPLFIHMGISELSVNISSISKLKKMLSCIDTDLTEKAWTKIAKCKRSGEIKSNLNGILQEMDLSFLLNI